MAEFWKRIVKLKPDLIGTVVYFSPTKTVDLACIVQSDGTISAVTQPSIRFDSISKLVEAWKKGDILSERGAKFPRNVKPSKLSFVDDFFFKTGRRDIVWNIFRGRVKKSNLVPDTQENTPQSTACDVGEPSCSMEPSDCHSSADQTVLFDPVIQSSPLATPISDEITAATSMENSFSVATTVNSLVENLSAVEHVEDGLSVSTCCIGLDEVVMGEVECSDIESAGTASIESAVLQSSALFHGENALPDYSSASDSCDAPTRFPPVGGTQRIPSIISKPCPGFERRRHDPVINRRKLDSTRMEVSPVIIDGDRCWSKQCIGEINNRHQSLCWCCKNARKRLYNARRYLKKNVDDAKGITKTSNRWLTTEEKLKKSLIVLKKKLQKKMEENRLLKMELRKYRPDHPDNRPASKSIKKVLDREKRKVDAPICQWVTDTLEVCGHRASSIILLNRHIRQEHFEDQLEMNKERLSNDKKYVCNWKGCRRRVPFSKFEFLRRHVPKHSGNAQTGNRLTVLQEKLVNLSREPTGRRYSAITRQTMLKNYESRRIWNQGRNRDILGESDPSLRSMLAWKNYGGVKSGIDWTILLTMEIIGRAAPNLKHGIITFDEIYVNPKKLLAPNGSGEFGMADNVDGELARTVLVFQYIALFSRKKFAISVAWYGCGIETGLNAEQLEKWLFEVMLALQRHGFRVHAIVCDGLATNLSLQKKLVLDAIHAELEDCHDYAIPHPLTTDPDLRLFFFFDPSHLIKLLRNRLFNKKILAFTSDSPSLLFDHMELRLDVIRWSDFDLVRQWQRQYPRVERRLTKRHLELNNYSKMTVQLAIDVMSEPVEDVLLEIDALGTTSTRYYMRAGRDLWLAMNDHRVYFNENDAKPMFEKLNNASGTFNEWLKNTVADTDLCLTDPQFTGIDLLCNGVPPFMKYAWEVVGSEVPGIGISPSIISQDNLEKTFGALRQKCGGTQHITVLGIAFNSRTLNEIILNDFKLDLNIRE